MKFSDIPSKSDDDFAKKMETNTVSKALSKLGFSADVFLGKFDDNKYVVDQKLKAELEAIETGGDDVKKDATKDFREWAEKQIKTYKKIPNKKAVMNVYQRHMEEAKAKCQALGIDFNPVGEKFQAAQREQMAKIEEKERLKTEQKLTQQQEKE